MDAHVVIVGGGIAGLSAALAVREALPSSRITIVEQSAYLGGKVRTVDFLGVPTETGAESFLVRVPEARDLAARVGLEAEVIHPVESTASLYVDGELRPFPTGTVMGVPTSGEESPAPPLGAADVSVGAALRPRLGDRVVDRLVEPLLGGVYAGRADDLSLDMTMPAFATQVRRCGSAIEAARAVRAASSGSGPVFGSIRGGLTRLVEAMASAARADIRHGSPVREVARRSDGWRVVVGSTRAPEILDADAVVLAVPAAPAARLLTSVSAHAAALVAELRYASVALVTLAVRGGLPPGSGALVATGEGLTVKAVTYLGQKWGNPAPDGLAVVRASVGRFGDEAVLQREDGDLVRLVVEDLRTIIGPIAVAESRVTRWGGALPQYAPGHRDRVDRVRTSLDACASLAVAGAAYDGVGIPAVIRSGVAAGTRVASALASEGQSRHG